MKLSPSKARSLEFPIGENTYDIPPAGVTAGIKLAEVLTTPPAQRGKIKLTSVDMFRLAIGDVWDTMIEDGVPYSEAFRVGMACLAREQVLLAESGPDRWDKAEAAAQAVWESGLDPEALAAWAAAQTKSGTGSTNRATRRAAAATTRSTKRGTGTRTKPATTSRKASRSRGSGSAASGR